MRAALSNCLKYLYFQRATDSSGRDVHIFYVYSLFYFNVLYYTVYSGAVK